MSAVSNAALFSVPPSVNASGDLSYTPAANAFGTSTFTLAVQDNGGVANGGVDTSATQTFTVTVTGVNDAPSFSAVDPATVLEDAGAQTLTGWASFNAGPGEGSQAVQAYTVTAVSNAALFAVPPAVSTDGTLSYTLAANAFGTSTFTVEVQDNGGTANGGIDTSAPQIFTLTVTGVNDEPGFTATNPPAVDEDSGAQTVTAWASFNAGPNESAQAVQAYSVTLVGNPSLFSVQPSVNVAGDLSYTPAANASGTSTFTVQVQDNGGVANGGDDTSQPQTFTITVNGLNDDPTAVDDTLTVLEDAPVTVVDVRANDTDIDGNTLTVTAVSDPANGTATLAAGVVSYQPDANYFGSDSFTYTVSDGNGGTATATVNVTVTAVNDAPSFTVGPNQTPTVGSVGLVTVPGFMTNLSAGPANESAQTLCFLSDFTDPNGAVSSLAIACDGTLSYTLTGNGGVVTVNARIRDNGGTANGGIDTSAVQTFTITAPDPRVDVAVVKTGRYTLTGITWELLVSNTGPSPANGATVIDALPAEVSAATWTCATQSGGATCAAASGSGDVDVDVNLPANSSVVVTITATLIGTPAAVSNTAEVLPPDGFTDTNTGNNTSTLNLPVALFSNGFEGGTLPGVALKNAAGTVEVSGELLEGALEGYKAVNAVQYTLDEQKLQLQVREINGLMQVRLLQAAPKQSLSTTRWIEVWPGDVVRIDYAANDEQLQTRLAVGM